MDKVILELRAGVGGEDARLFMGTMLQMYTNFCNKMGFSMSPLISLPGKNIVIVSGQSAYS